MRVPQLRVPRVVNATRSLEARCKRAYDANAHLYFINSVSASPDQGTFVSSDDLCIHLWNLERADSNQVILDMRPVDHDYTAVSYPPGLRGACCSRSCALLPGGTLPRHPTESVGASPELPHWSALLIRAVRSPGCTFRTFRSAQCVCCRLHGPLRVRAQLSCGKHVWGRCCRWHALTARALCGAGQGQLRSHGLPAAMPVCSRCVLAPPCASSRPASSRAASGSPAVPIWCSCDEHQMAMPHAACQSMGGAHACVPAGIVCMHARWLRVVPAGTELPDGTDALLQGCDGSPCACSRCM